MMLIKPNAFQACFANWLQSLRATAAEKTGVTQPILAVDGKTVRRSQIAPKAGSFAFGQCLGQRIRTVVGNVASAEKSTKSRRFPRS